MERSSPVLNSEKKKFVFAPKIRCAGFTLIEALVVIFIIALISSLILANYRSGQKRYTLEQAAQELISNIRKAQILSLSPGSGKVGYGIYLTTSDNIHYVLFTEITGASDRSYNSGEEIETITLPSKIIISSISSSPLNIFFEPPDPATYINNSSGPPTITAAITLQEQTTGLIKTITVKTNGFIE